MYQQRPSFSLRYAKRVHLAERFFAISLFALGLVLGLGFGGFLSLGFLF